MCRSRMSGRRFRPCLVASHRPKPKSRKWHRIRTKCIRVCGLWTDVRVALCRPVGLAPSDASCCGGCCGGCAGVGAVFSSAKYPAAKVLPEFDRVYDEHESHALQTVANTRSQYIVAS